MPPIDHLVTRYQLYLHQWLASSSMKRFFTLVVLLLSLYYAYDRISRNRRRQLTAAQAAAGATNSARASLHPPPPSTSADSSAVSSSAPVQRLLTSLSSSSSAKPVQLSPVAKYLSPSKPQRCVLLSLPGVVLDEHDRPIERVVPLLHSLAQHTRLVLITQTDDSQRERSILQTLRDMGLMASGLKEHRVLFCSTAKGRSAMIRQLEPTLCVDDDAEVLQLIKPFIVDVVQVAPAAVISSFTPPTLTSLNAVPPPSTSTSSSSSSSSSHARAERRLWKVPSLEVWFFGTAAAESKDGEAERERATAAATATPIDLLS